jgi:hypothetical protein
LREHVEAVSARPDWGHRTTARRPNSFADESRRSLQSRCEPTRRSLPRGIDRPGISFADSPPQSRRLELLERPKCQSHSRTPGSQILTAIGDTVNTAARLEGLPPVQNRGLKKSTNIEKLSGGRFFAVELGGFLRKPTPNPCAACGRRRGGRHFAMVGRYDRAAAVIGFAGALPVPRSQAPGWAGIRHLLQLMGTLFSYSRVQNLDFSGSRLLPVSACSEDSETADSGSKPAVSCPSVADKSCSVSAATRGVSD